MARTGALCSLLMIVASTAGCSSADAGDVIYLGTKIRSNQRVSMEEVDHAVWDALLEKYVDSNGMVDYAAWEASAKDRARLKGYLQTLSVADWRIKASRDARLAFWINAYNAVTIEGILREYPTGSIRNHTAKLFGYNIWEDLQLYVGGKPYSLEQIEHEILRKMGEPRIHFAIVCASIGCPRLLAEAYVAERLDRQLEANARDFFARPKNFRYDRESGRFYLSSILDWFGEDFGGSQAAQLKTIAPWLPAEPARQAANEGRGDVRYLDYDWKLNEQESGQNARR